MPGVACRGLCGSCSRTGEQRDKPGNFSRELQTLLSSRGHKLISAKSLTAQTNCAQSQWERGDEPSCHEPLGCLGPAEPESDKHVKNQTKAKPGPSQVSQPMRPRLRAPSRTQGTPGRLGSSSGQRAELAVLHNPHPGPIFQLFLARSSRRAPALAWGAQWRPTTGHSQASRTGLS